jgi:hypothetical protein
VTINEHCVLSNLTSLIWQIGIVELELQPVGRSLSMVGVKNNFQTQQLWTMLTKLAIHRIIKKMHAKCCREVG